jgi:chromosome segregation ATPase
MSSRKSGSYRRGSMKSTPKTRKTKVRVKDAIPTIDDAVDWLNSEERNYNNVKKELDYYGNQQKSYTNKIKSLESDIHKIRINIETNKRERGKEIDKATKEKITKKINELNKELNKSNENLENLNMKLKEVRKEYESRNRELGNLVSRKDYLKKGIPMVQKYEEKFEEADAKLGEYLNKKDLPTNVVSTDDKNELYLDYILLSIEQRILWIKTNMHYEVGFKKTQATDVKKEQIDKLKSDYQEGISILEELSSKLRGFRGEKYWGKARQYIRNAEKKVVKRFLATIPPGADYLIHKTSGGVEELI